ncbi:MAG: sugar phosphate isomerase/epimerase [Candidatus Hydrogenedentes bacterium]|nr:sugar phosphate isomerase/epimerase [Candidatus Hydrogenedentota bacterium]
MKTYLALALVALVAVLGIPAAAHADEKGSPVFESFFPFCIDTHDSQKRNLEQQALMLKELGYDGVGHLWLDNVPERLATLDAQGLKLFQITTTINMDPKAAEPYDPRLLDVMRSLKGRNVEFLLIMNKLKSSDESADPRAVEIVTKLAGIAQENGLTLLLYPHTGDWIEKIEDAVRVAKKVNRPNVGVMFNLCHWLRAGKGENLKPLLEQAMPYLRAVSINGADTAAEVLAGSGNWIQPLGSGTFDMLGLLKTLRELGYRGPIGLQCYGLGGDARDHLSRSVEAWRKLSARLAAE